MDSSMFSKELGTSVYLVQTHSGGHNSVPAVRGTYEEAVDACKDVAKGCMEYWEASTNKSGCTTMYITVVAMHTHGEVWSTGQTASLFTAMLERRGKAISLSLGGVPTPLDWVNTEKGEGSAEV